MKKTLSFAVAMAMGGLMNPRICVVPAAVPSVIHSDGYDDPVVGLKKSSWPPRPAATGGPCNAMVITRTGVVLPFQHQSSCCVVPTGRNQNKLPPATTPGCQCEGSNGCG